MGMFSKQVLIYAAYVNPDGIYRLARFMKLHPDGYSPRQTAKLIWWLMRKQEKRQYCGVG